MTGSELSPKVKLVEDMPDKPNDLITYARNKIILFTDGTYITTLIPTLAIVTGHVDDLSDSQAKVKLRTIGLASDRDADKVFVQIDLNCWAALVQYAASLDPPNAKVIIESYGYRSKRMPETYKLPFEVRQTKISGKVQLITKSPGKNTYYERQMSTDGHEWTDLEGTMFCKIFIENLKPGATYFFRCRTTNNKGKSEWSQMVVIIVV